MKELASDRGNRAWTTYAKEMYPLEYEAQLEREKLQNFIMRRKTAMLTLKNRKKRLAARKVLERAKQQLEAFEAAQILSRE